MEGKSRKKEERESGGVRITVMSCGSDGERGKEREGKKRLKRRWENRRVGELKQRGRKGGGIKFTVVKREGERGEELGEVRIREGEM